MNTKVNVDVVSVNTKKTQNEFKTLKQKIKELKLELETLDEGTVEYQAKLTELGNAMHQQSEIVEQAKLASIDYGDTLQSITKASAGLVASISAVNGVMNLLGTNSDEATQALLKVQSLMAIVQGLSALDEAEKAFQSLFTKIKLAISARKENAIETQKDTITTNQNTNAVNTNVEALDTQSKTLSKGISGLKTFGNGIKNLGKSLKAFALSNPFTLIITGITTAITLISKFVEKAKQARIDARNALNDSLQLSVDLNTDNTKQNTFSNSSNAQAYQNELNQLRNTQNELEQNQKRLSKNEIESKKISINYTNAEISLKHKQLDIEQQRLDTYTEEQKQVEPFLTEYQDYLKNRINLYHQQYRIEVENIKLLKSELSYYKKGSDDYNNILEKLEQANKRLNTIVQENILQSYQNIDSLDKQKQTLLDKQNEEAQQKRDKDLQKQYNDIKEWLELETKQLELNYNKRKITERDYYNKSIELYKQYNEKLNEIKNNPNVSKIDLLSSESSVLDAEKKKAEYELSLIQNRVIQAEQIDIAVVDEKRKLEADIEDYKQLMLENNNKIKELQNKHWLEQYNILQKQNNVTEAEQIAYLDNMLAIEQQYLDEQEQVLNNNNNRDKSIINERYERDIEALKYSLKEKLISQEQYETDLLNLKQQYNNNLLNLDYEYNLSLLDIQQQRNQIEMDYSNERYNIAKSEVERKIELNDLYFNSFQNIQSQLGSFLSEMQGQYDENSEQYKQLQRLQIIMDSSSGAYSAFVSAFKSGLPFPYNTIIASALSGLVVAQGVMSLNNLNSNKISTSNAVSNMGNSSVYETLSYETMSEMNKNIKDSKVFVVESEIQAVANRINVTESEAIF